MNYIEKKNLNEKQFGFNYMVIIELVDKVTSVVEKTESTLGIFLDLPKAFDTIDHDKLLYKLEYHGFRGIILDWLKSYHYIRKQFFNINHGILSTKIFHATCEPYQSLR